MSPDDRRPFGTDLIFSALPWGLRPRLYAVAPTGLDQFIDFDEILRKGGFRRDDGQPEGADRDR